MARRVREFPRWRAMLAVSVLLGGVRGLPACETPPPPPVGNCYAIAVEVASDHACMMVGPPTTWCAPRGDAGASGGNLQGCYLASSEMRCWGTGGLGRAGLASAATPARVDFGARDGGAGPAILAMAVGTNRTCALLEGGRLRCWSGQESAASARDEDLPPVIQMSMGDEHLCVLLADRTVRCRGSNADGQLGTSSVRGSSNSFVPVAEIDEIQQIGTGQRATCALTTSGEVFCWGRLGATAHSTPNRVAGLSRDENLRVRIERITVGGRHACGVDSSGDVWCWGANEARQLGRGTQASASPSAVRVELNRSGEARRRANHVTAGDAHTCAVLEDGPGWVRCWGNNRDGQLGQAGGESSEGSPVAVPVTVRLDPTEAFPRFSTSASISEVSLVDAAGKYTCAIERLFLADGGKVRCWGRLAGFAPTPIADTIVQCCAPTPAEPSGMCPNTQSDPRNCGRAGNVCPATQVCRSGTCGCAAGQTMVGTSCFDLQSDARNCGRAGNVCALANVATQTCRNGACAVEACAPGFADCDGMAANGCEVNTASDANHCGRCGTRCAGPNSMGACAMGACGALTCNAGFEDCNNDPTDGCETDTRTTSTCRSRPTALPAGSRTGAGRHVVNIVTPDVSDRDLAMFFSTGGTARLARAAETFYRSYRDEYDFLFVVSTAYIPNADAAAQFTPVQRDAIPGTGLFAANQPVYRTGAPRRLRGVVGVNLFNATSTPPSLHEILHYWGVSLPAGLIGDGAHWNVAGVGGQLGGFPASLATCGSGGTVAACQGSSVCCASGTTNCGGRCVDTSSDPNHCGGCGIVCSTGPGTTMNTCMEGVCVPTCATGYGSCDRNAANGCEVPITTVERCGGRCLRVADGQGCVDYGRGSYGPGLECGAVGQVVCPSASGMPPCQTGLTMTRGPGSTICCAAGATNCGGACATTSTDRNNCGACGTICATGPGTTTNTCMGGVCRPACASGFADCDGDPANGCEARLDSVTHCGRCGNRCAAMDQACTGAGTSFSCTTAAGAAGRVCASGATRAGTCGGAQTCSASVSLRLPSLPASDACRTATGQARLRWGTVTSPSDSIPYAPLELYLMGLIGRADAGGPWYVLDDAEQPPAGELWTGARVRTVTLDDIVRETGAERPPAPMSERAFKTAVVVFSATPVSAAWLDNIERWSSILGNDRRDDPCFMSFERATGGRATMSTVLGPTRRPLP